MYVYKITNTLNGKVYIGQTGRTIETRWIEHLSTAKYSSNTSEFYNSIKKHGKDVFILDKLYESDDTSEIDMFEISFIKYFRSVLGTNNVYNLSEGGKVNRGYHHTEETKKKLSKIHKGNKYSVGKNLGDKNGSTTEESRIKISNKLKGNHPMSEENKKKLSDRRKGRRVCNTVSGKGIKIICNEIKTDPMSVLEMSRFLNIVSGGIYNSIKYDKKYLSFTFKIIREEI